MQEDAGFIDKRSGADFLKANNMSMKIFNDETPTSSFGLKPSLFAALWLMATCNVVDALKPMRNVKGSPIIVRSDEFRVWALGHATIFLNFYGTTIITDPVLVNFLPWPRRIVSAPYTVDDLPRIDYAVISHAHFDHFNLPTLRALALKVQTLIVPPGCHGLVRKYAFRNVLELSWEKEIHDNRGFCVRALRVAHWGQRYPWDKEKRGFNGYLFTKHSRSVFFAGDTAYRTYFKEYGRRFHIDIALLPIGSYQPEGFLRNHLSPEEALQVFLDLKASYMIPLQGGISVSRLNRPANLRRVSYAPPKKKPWRAVFASSTTEKLS